MLWAVVCLLGWMAAAAPAGAQAHTVLFDGLPLEQGKASALLIPAVISGNDYSAGGRLQYSVADRFQIHGELSGTFNGGATASAGFGWAANIVQQSSAFPLNFGLFNSYLFPIRSGGPDVLVNVSPVFSHSFDRARGGRVTPYAGASIVFNPGNPGTSVNGLFGVRVAEIADRWDFVAEVQPGESTQLALGFVFRF
jgi:hypothetical protein